MELQKALLSVGSSLESYINSMLTVIGLQAFSFICNIGITISTLCCFSLQFIRRLLLRIKIANVLIRIFGTTLK